jgi:hypothetical protein
MFIYRYRLKSTGYSSDKYGKCEVCGKYVSEVFLQVEERYYKFEHNGQIYEGWTKNGCKDYFGHKKCLKSVQKYTFI